MYVKIFGSIVDSSIWRESVATRIVWFTLLATCDETGLARYAALWNLARRANVSEEEAAAAVAVLESPDPDSTDHSNGGRRIERIAGGWVILNYSKYRKITSKEHRRAYQREYKREARRESKPDLLAAGSEVSKFVETLPKVKKEDTAERLAFLQVWSAVPLKKGKSAAERCFIKFAKKYGVEIAADRFSLGIVNYVASPRFDGQAWKHGSTLFNEIANGDWDEVVYPWSQKNDAPRLG